MFGCFVLDEFSGTLWAWPIARGLQTVSWKLGMSLMSRIENLSGWWFQTFFIFHNIWDNPSYWLIFFKMVETTNQVNLGDHVPSNRWCNKPGGIFPATAGYMPWDRAILGGVHESAWFSMVQLVVCPKERENNVTTSNGNFRTLFHRGTVSCDIFWGYIPYMTVYIQCEAPKIAKLVYKPNNYGLWYL